jgi:hypothetical protein
MGLFKKNASDKAAEANMVAHAMQARSAALDQVAEMAPMAQAAADMMRGMNMPEMAAYAAKMQRISANGADGIGTIVATRTVGPGSSGMGTTLDFDVSVTGGPGAPRSVTIRQEMMGDLSAYQPGAEVTLRINAANCDEALIWGAPGGTATSEAGAAALGSASSSSSGDDRIARLEHLGRLRDSGAISPQEFEENKARILAGG